jgi:hypothetical protein
MPLRKALAARVGLATCGIGRPEWACENHCFCLVLLADSPEKEDHLKH